MKNDKNYAFVFDIGRVLLDFDFDRAIFKLEDFTDKSFVEIKNTIFVSGEGKKIIVDYESGRIDSSTFYQAIKDLVDLEIDFEDFSEIWSDIFTENRDVFKFLTKISDYPKAIVSNTCPLHWERELADSSIKLFFDECNIITSYRAGYRKPNPCIYDLAKNKLPANSEIIYFDDIEEYIEASSALGFRGIKYDCRVDDIEKVLKENDLLL
jgi:FMN phosphatase YigB (HAD superfamily)